MDRFQFVSARGDTELSIPGEVTLRELVALGVVSLTFNNSPYCDGTWELGAGVHSMQIPMKRTGLPSRK